MMLLLAVTATAGIRNQAFLMPYSNAFLQTSHHDENLKHLQALHVLLAGPFQEETVIPLTFFL